MHQNKRAIVVQQEVLTDVRSFNRALIHVLRQDPDVIVIGEMRDHEAISTALTAAETGHLVLATMHSPNTAHALERIVGVFEGNAQRQIVLQLANALQGIVSQDLLPAADRTRRVLAYELLIANNAVRNLIRDGQLHQMENTLQTSRKEGMVLMDNCLYDLYCKCLITYDTAMSRARHPDRPHPAESTEVMLHDVIRGGNESGNKISLIYFDLALLILPMNILSNLSAQQLRRAADIQEKIAALQDELSQYLERLSFIPRPGYAGAKRRMSAAGRARIIAAQKARWAKVRGTKGQASSLQKTKKRTMSAAAKAKIAAAARARWAKAKAAGRKAL